MTAPFAGNVVVLTGASAGIGREMALQLARQGALLALAARDAARLEEAADACRALGASAVAVPTDVGDEGQCARLVARAGEAYGRIDTLICNAGIGMWARFDEVTDLGIFERIMRVNYLGAVYCVAHALPYLKRTRGRIVGIGSLTARTGVPTRSGYAASKHALTGFLESIRIELEEEGVSVTIVQPGFVATEIRERALGADGTPLGRGNSPVREHEVMRADECARLTLEAAAKRKREVVMTSRAQLGRWLKLLAPALVDRMAARAVARGK